MKPIRCDDTGNDTWFRQSFGDLYPLIYAHRSVEAASEEIRALAGWIPIRPGDVVLDACCGNGRHLAGLQRSGCSVFGFDLSAELIRQAIGRPGFGLRVCRADIRDIPFRDHFDAVLNLFTSFGYFQQDTGNKRAFHALCGCLATGGRLVIDHMNAGRIRTTLEPETVSFLRGLRIVQQRWIRGNRVQKRIEITNSLGDQTVFREDVRLYEPEEMIELAKAEGLVSICLAGDFDGRPFGPESHRMILTARRS